MKNDIKTNYVLCLVTMAQDLIEEYKQKQDQHLAFSKTFEENKASLDSLKRNLEIEDDDGAKVILTNVITLLESYVSTKKQKYDTLSKDLSEAKERLDKYKEDVTNQMRETLKMYERLNNEVYKEDTESIIAAKCAKHLYPKDTDNLDLRFAPAICGVVNKFDRPTIKGLGHSEIITESISAESASKKNTFSFSNFMNLESFQQLPENLETNSENR